MSKVQEVIVKARFKMPLWDCIKLRICGLCNTVSSIETVGDFQSTSFKAPVNIECVDNASIKLKEAEDLLIQNEYKCTPAIWKKFSADEKLKYNEIRKQLKWDMLYHVNIYTHKNKAEIIDVTAHNIACQLVWTKK